MQVNQAEQDSVSPPISPEPMPEVALPPGFKKVMVCLQSDLSPLIASNVPLELMQPEVIVKPIVTTVCTRHIVQDKAMGVTYMDMVTASVG